MEKQLCSSSSTGEDKTILFQLMEIVPHDEKAELDEKVTYKWYVIEQEKEKEKEKEGQNSKKLKEEESGLIGSGGGKLRVLEFPKMPYAVPVTNTQCFAVGSRIYVFGGISNVYGWLSSHPIDADVYYLDLHCLHQCWKEGPYLNMPRAFSLAAVDNEKAVAYVSSEWLEWNVKKEPTFEVFDYHKDIWKPLPEPPINATSVSMLAVFDGGNKLLFSLRYSSSALCYNVKDGTWEVFDPNFGDFKGQPAVIGNTLFCCGALPDAEDINMDRALYAYDLDKREWLLEPVRGHLFHINQDKLCLLWCRSYWCIDPDEKTGWKNGFHVHCTKFNISKDDKGYLAHVESYNDYFLDGSDANFLAM